MAESRTETIILHLEVDQEETNNQLLKTEKNLLALKKQQQDLNKEYKEGKISEDQYIKSNIALQNAVKKETEQKRTLTKLLETESNSRNALKNRVSQLVKEYDNLNLKSAEGARRGRELAHELTELNKEINKTSKQAGLFKDQIGNYPRAFLDATDQVQPFGVSVSSLGESMSKFATPAGLALGALTGLAVLYSQSAAGARDLQFAQNLVSSSVSILADNVGEFVDGEGEQQIGLFSRLVGQALAYLDVNTAVQAAIQAGAKQRIQDLELERSLAQAQSKIEEKIAEDARRIRDDESKSLQERLAQTEEIDDALNKAGKGVVAVLKEQVTAVITSTTNFEKNKQAQLEVSRLAGEIADKEEEINGKLTENVVARRNILKLIQEQAEFEAAVTRADQRTFSSPESADQNTRQLSNEIEGLSSGTRTDEAARITAEAQAQQLITDAFVSGEELRARANMRIGEDILKFNKDLYERDAKFKLESTRLKNQIDEAYLQSAISITGSIASLFNQQSTEYKIAATAQTLISTYATAQKAYEAAFTPPTVASPFLAGAYVSAAIIQGLANVAQINGIQFFKGGYTGPGGKYEPAGTVHKGEVVWNQQDVALAGGPAMANALRPTTRQSYNGRFYDGGIVTNSISQPINQQIELRNIMKQMPPIEVSVKEVTKVQNKIAAKEKISSL